MEAGVAGVEEKRRWQTLDQNKSDYVNYNDTVNTSQDGLTFNFVILLYCSEWERPVFRSRCMMQNNTCPTSRDNRIREQPQKHPQQRKHSYIH